MALKSVTEQKKMVIVLITIVSVLLILATLQQLLNLRRYLEAPEHQTIFLLWALSVLNVILLVIFSLILLRYLIKLYWERKNEELGSKFRTKLVVAFLGMIFIPMLFMSFFSVFMLNRNIDKWFSTPIDQMLDNLERQVSGQIQMVAVHASEQARQLSADPELFAWLDNNSKTKPHDLIDTLYRSHVSLWAVFDQSNNLLLFFDGTDLLSPSLPQFKREAQSFPFIRWSQETPTLDEAITKALFGQAEAGQYLIQSLGKNGPDIVLAGASVPSAILPGGHVVAGQLMPANFMKLSEQVSDSRRYYQSLAANRKFVRNNYLLWMGVITILILFAAVWIGMYLSRRITTPIKALAEAAEQVSRGNLLFQIDCEARDELGLLVSMFNRMTVQLHDSAQKLEQTNRDLQGSNQALEEKRRYTEAVLENIPTGVISVKPDFSVATMNRAAQHMMGCEPQPEVNIDRIFREDDLEEIRELIRKAERVGYAAKEMPLHLLAKSLYCAVTISSLDVGLRSSQGFVMVLEDLTEVLKAQKANAWREVARRMAHEIKNPLTPIQLSAERLIKNHRKLGETPYSTSEDQRQLFGEILEDSVGTITREVSTLKRMVDEFSRFARLPSAALAPSNLNAVIENTLTAYDGRFEGVEVSKSLAFDLPTVQLDPEQFRRVFINLFDNALEAMEQAALRQIGISTEYLPRIEAIRVVVKDTGQGIDPADKDKLFLPYFSTRKRGTGLGLAIVSRIVADHKGFIHVEDNKPNGACFIIEIPTRP